MLYDGQRRLQLQQLTNTDSLNVVQAATLLLCVQFVASFNRVLADRHRIALSHAMSKNFNYRRTT